MKTLQEIADFTGLKIVVYSGEGDSVAYYRLDKNTITPVHIPVDLDDIPSGKEFIPQITCPECRRRGYYFVETEFGSIQTVCENCQGTGKIPKELK